MGRRGNERRNSERPVVSARTVPRLCVPSCGSSQQLPVVLPSAGVCVARPGCGCSGRGKPNERRERVLNGEIRKRERETASEPPTSDMHDA